ncbi:MAG: aspartate carbamoyltransferase catalytic subunit, partial [Actinomycetota bacterium]
MKHLLAIDELGLDGLNALLNLTDHMVEINQRPVPKVPALRGRTVASLFFEDSTRTRLSFETAAKRLSADTMTFNVSTSSVNKGESLRDTVATITDMGVDAFVVRHKSVGIPWQISEWTKASIINAGDGAHQHPTQALVDCYTIREATHAKRFSGMHMVIVGDIKHSRVARSNIQAFSMLGAAVTLVAPPTLLPPDVSHWPVAVSHNLDDVLPQTDVLYMLRLQSERMAQGHVPTLREYSEQYGLTQ